MNPRSFATADLYDAHSQSVQSCSTQLRPYGGRRIFSGRIRTVRCSNDNVLIRQVLSGKSNGDVLVVDGGDSLDSALLGDLMAELGRNNGWAGIVIFGAVRDAVALAKIDFGVKALGTNPRKSRKDGVGAIDPPLRHGGADFLPGAWIYCDDDGVLTAAQELG